MQSKSNESPVQGFELELKLLKSNLFHFLVSSRIAGRPFKEWGSDTRVHINYTHTHMLQNTHRLCLVSCHGSKQESPYVPFCLSLSRIVNRRHVAVLWRKTLRCWPGPTPPCRRPWKVRWSQTPWTGSRLGRLKKSYEQQRVGTRNFCSVEGQRQTCTDKQQTDRQTGKRKGRST